MSRLPWPARAPKLVLLVALLLTVASAALALRLRVKADLANLLPAGASSVRDLEEVQRRAQAFGSLLVAVEADRPAARAAAATDLIARLRKLDPALVASIVADEGGVRRYVWEHRYLFAPLSEIEEAHDGLRRRLAKLNPLFVDLSEGDDAPGAVAGQGQATPPQKDQLQALRERMNQAEERARTPAGLLSKDQKIQLVIVRATFPSADVSRSRRLRDGVQAAMDAAGASAGPAVRMGTTGDIVTVTLEQEAIVEGMTFATVVTTVLVGLGLLLYFRSLAAIAVILGGLSVGTLGTFAFAWLSIGYLNSATAFLISVVIGNGINFPILVVARYLEERRNGADNRSAVAGAWSGTLPGTTAAAFTAAVAYGSLIVTDFRGFRHFGIIGGVGMLLCWAAAYTVVPAALSLLGRRGRFDRPAPEPAVGRWVARMLPGRSAGPALAIAAVATALVVVAIRYIASDPFEYDLRQVRSSSAQAVQARQWQEKLDAAFGRGIAGGFVFALDRREDARKLTEQLKGLTFAGQSSPLLARVSSLDELVPADQEEKLALLAGIRRLIDRHASKMSAADRAEVMSLRPPDDLRPIGDGDVPAELALRFTEKDGTRGRLIFANTSAAVESWDGRELTALSQRIRSLDLPAGTRIAGNAFVFADMVEVIRRDGPKATMVALFGVLLVVAVTVGVGLHGALTAASAVLGAMAMLALAALAGLKVNFLDFVALPLTLGIGTDYAANVLLRSKQEGRGGARRALLTTGSAVFLCSFTTVVGYGSLLVSDNAGIRSFGTAAIFGELTCMAAGILVGLVLLDRWDARRRPRPVLVPPAIPAGPEPAPVPVLSATGDQGRDMIRSSAALARYGGKRS
jgi:uncharacterized protein